MAPGSASPYAEDCAFCRISAAYPAQAAGAIPTSPDPNKISPQCHLILSTPHILAFLDIMPIAPGHVLLTTRTHYEKLSDLQGSFSASKRSDWTAARSAAHAEASAAALGKYLPVISRALCKVTGVEDWNVVQNNGVRASQVVPHIHFHLIPRYQEGRLGQKTTPDVGMLKSWKMFGKGAREDLDDDEGAELARLLRDAIAGEIGSEQAKL